MRVFETLNGTLRSLEGPGQATGGTPPAPVSRFRSMSVRAVPNKQSPFLSPINEAIDAVNLSIPFLFWRLRSQKPGQSHE